MPAHITPNNGMGTNDNKMDSWPKGSGFREVRQKQNMQGTAGPLGSQNALRACTTTDQPFNQMSPYTNQTSSNEKNFDYV